MSPGQVKVIHKAQGTSPPREDRYRSVTTAAIHGTETVTGLTLMTLFTL